MLIKEGKWDMLWRTTKKPVQSDSKLLSVAEDINAICIRWDDVW